MRLSLILTLLFAMLLTPQVLLAQDDTVITTDNVTELTLQNRVMRGSADVMTWSADGAHILVGGTLGVWRYDATALDTVTEPLLMPTNGEVAGVATYEVDGATVVAAVHDEVDGAQVFDLATGEAAPALALELGDADDMTSGGQYVTFNHGFSGVSVLDTATGTIYTNEEVDLSREAPVVVIPETTQVAWASSSGNNVIIWDFVAGGEPMELAGHSGGITDLTVSSDGALLVSASTDDSFIVWNVATGDLLQTFDQPDDPSISRDVYAVAFSPDGSTLLSGHNQLIRVWDVASRSQSGEFASAGRTSGIEFSPDGSQVAVIVSDNYREAVQLFSADGTLQATTTFHNHIVSGLAFNADDTTLAFSDNQSVLFMWDTVNQPEITEAISIPERASSNQENKGAIAFSSDGQHFAVEQSFAVLLLDTATGNIIHEIRVAGSVIDISFSPDDTMLAVATSGGLDIIDPATGQIVVNIDDANDWLTDVVWSRDQTMVATGSSDHAVRLYTIGG